MVRANGDINMAKADLGHTLPHELAHVIGPEVNSIFMEANMDQTACFANEMGVNFMAFAGSELNGELQSDLKSAPAIAQNIIDGNTFGLSPRDYVVKSMQRLCGVPGGKSHPGDRQRFDLLLKTLRSIPASRDALGCPTLLPGESVCGMQGRKDADI